MLRKKEDKELNYTKINELVGLSNNLLKILFVLIIILGAYAVIMLIKEVKILPLIFSVLGVLSPLFIGIIVAWLFDPIVTYLEKKGLRRIFGGIICYVLFLGLITLVVSALIPVLSEQVNDFVTTTIPNVFEYSKNAIDGIFDNFNNIESIDAIAMKEDIFKKLEEFATNLTSSLPEIAVSTVKSIFSGLGSLLIGLIIGFYLLLDFDKNTETLYSLIPKKMRGDVKECLKSMNKPLKRFVNGSLIDCTIIFIITGIGFSIIGLKAPLLFALFCAITNVIPYAGPYIGGAPAVVVGLSQSTPIGIAVLIFIAVVQLLEGNLIQPLIMSRTTKLNPVTIIIGLLVFGHLFGIVGMVLSTPIIGACKELVAFLDEKYDIINFNN